MYPKEIENVLVRLRDREYCERTAKCLYIVCEAALKSRDALETWEEDGIVNNDIVLSIPELSKFVIEDKCIGLKDSRGCFYTEYEEVVQAVSSISCCLDVLEANEESPDKIKKIDDYLQELEDLKIEAWRFFDIPEMLFEYAYECEYHCSSVFDAIIKHYKVPIVDKVRAYRPLGDEYYSVYQWCNLKMSKYDEYVWCKGNGDDEPGGLFIRRNIVHITLTEPIADNISVNDAIQGLQDFFDLCRIIK
jgi:hypothetical protein